MRSLPADSVLKLLNDYIVDKMLCSRHLLVLLKECNHVEFKGSYNQQIKNAIKTLLDPKKLPYQYIGSEIVLNYYIRDWRNKFPKKLIENILKREDNEVLLWKKEVLRRDNYKCRECGEKDRLHVHHIKEWALYPQHRIDIENGITLCNKCHHKKHTGISGGMFK